MTAYVVNMIALGLCLIVNVGGQIGFPLIVVAAIKMRAQVFQYRRVP